MPYPEPPHVKGSRTSEAAANSIEPDLGKLQARVHSLVKQGGRRGITSDEIQVLAGMKGSTVRPRLCELESKGLVYKTDQTRLTRTGRNAFVYVAEGHEESVPTLVASIGSSSKPAVVVLRSAIDDLRALYKEGKLSEELIEVARWLKTLT